jgi:hypothetical protein
VRGDEHLPAPAHQEHMQGVRGIEHLPAPAHQKPMQGVRGPEHLPAPAYQEQMQGRVQTTGAGAASQAEDVEEGALAWVPMHGPLQKRQKTVRTVSACCCPETPLLELEGVSEQQRAESPVHAPLAASVIVYASAEMEHPIAVGRAQASPQH